MELYLRSTALVLTAVVLGLMLKGQHKPMAALLSFGVCCMICISAVRYLSPVMDLLFRLRDLAGISGDMLSILLKAAGIGLLSELAVVICTDAGDSALGKAVGLLSNGVILWISLPLLEQLLEILQEVLGKA